VEKRTKEIAPLQRGFDLPTSDVVTGEYPVVYSNGILRKHNEYKVKAPGIVTGRSGTIGKVTYVVKDFWPHNTSLWITDFFDNDPKFIFYFYLRFKLNRYSAGSTVPTLNRNDVHFVKKRIPTPPEQTKIATFLTAIDKRINLLQKKKVQLEQYKKGVMQKLFAVKTDCNPSMRFKDDNGNNFPDWEEKKLGEVCESIKSGKTKPLGFGDFFVYGSTGVIGYCNDCSHEGKFLLAARVGANAGTLNVAEGKFGVTDNTLVLELDGSVEIDFMYSYLIKSNLKRLIFGSGQPLITGGQLKSLKVFLPSLTEQQKIASFLTSIDSSIENISNQIDNSIVFKKGLLQKMFV
jgi:type I restriction enzyme S subunit